MEAANYLLDNNLSAEEAATGRRPRDRHRDRFESEITKARALGALGRKDERSPHEIGRSAGTQPQVHSFARGLQASGRQDEALELFRLNIRKDPNTWVAHNETARLAVAKADFTTAVREMQLPQRPLRRRSKRSTLTSSGACRTAKISTSSDPAAVGT